MLRKKTDEKKKEQKTRMTIHTNKRGNINKCPQMSLSPRSFASWYGQASCSFSESRENFPIINQPLVQDVLW